MINPFRLSYLKEAIDFLQRQLELMINWVPKCKLALEEESDQQRARESITSLLKSDKEMVSGIYDKVKEFNTQELLEKLPIVEQVTKLCEIDDTLRKVSKDVKGLVDEYYAANFDPYLREIKKAISDIYSDLILLLPNISYEIGLLERHFHNPSNSERSILPELNESITLLNKHRISFREFLAGYNIGKNEFNGYDVLRSADSVFSPFQSYENLPTSYDQINGSVYNICKRLEPFFKEYRSDEDFAPFAEKFDEIKARTVTKKSDRTGSGKNISSMYDVFNIYEIFTKIFQKMAVKYSFKEEYQKSTEEYLNFEHQAEELVSYNMNAIENAENNLLDASQDEKSKNKIKAIMKEAEEIIRKKRLPFKRLEWLFQQMMKGNFDLVILERSKEDVTIPVTPETSERYGVNNLTKINLIIEEINFWLDGSEKQEKYNLIFTEIEKVNDGTSKDVADLMKEITEIDSDIETRFRHRYSTVIGEMGSVMISLKHVLTNPLEQKTLSDRLGETNQWQGYTKRLFEVRKNVIVANGLLKNSTMAKINLFPFINLANTRLSLILYEISMRIFSLYEKVDKRSINNMLNILVIFRDYHDVKSLWHTFSIFLEKKKIQDFAVLEDRIKLLTKNDIAKTKILIKFPTKNSKETIKHAN